jgi:cyclomaltodextrinase
MAWTDKPDRLVAAVGFLSSLSSPVVLFYGTETGLSHVAPKTGFTDVGRIPMPWQKLDTALTGRLRAILQARKQHPALTRGGRLPLLADKDVLVQAKLAPEETVLVGVNLSAAPREVELDTAGVLPPGAKLAPLLGDAPAAVGENGRLKWQLPPLATVMLLAPRAR